jgi:serine/threonine protein kinase
MLSIFSKLKNKISSIITRNRGHERLHNYNYKSEGIETCEEGDKHNNMTVVREKGKSSGVSSLEIIYEDEPYNTSQLEASPPSPPPPSPVIYRRLFNKEIDETLIKNDYELQNLLKIMEYHKFDISNVTLEKRFETMVNNIQNSTDINTIKMKLLYIIIANDFYRDLFEEKKQYHSIKIKQYIGVFRFNDYIIRIDDCPFSFMNEADVVQRMAGIKYQQQHEQQIIRPFLIYTNIRHNVAQNDTCECRKPSCDCIYTDKAEEEYSSSRITSDTSNISRLCFDKLRENTISFSLQHYVKESVSLYSWVKDNMAIDIYHRFSVIQRTFFLHLFYQCAKLLSEIHSVSIVHGDIKPDNILIYEHTNFNINHPERCKNFTVYLIDFGLSGIHNDGVGTGGTIPYCHPEFKNIKDTNRSSKYNWKKLNTKHDVWSLGLTFLTMYIYRDFYNYYHKYPSYFFLRNGYVSSLILDVITDTKIHDLFTKILTVDCISSNEVITLLENMTVS